MPRIDVYLETGKKRTFACAVDWPGWCRSGTDEAAALQALLDYAPRYARAIQSTGLGFQPPEDLSSFNVIERLEGSQTTDFGAPAAIPACDARSVEEADLSRFKSLLQAVWQAFDKAAETALGKVLRKGPRGGGREREGMVEHVLGAEKAYLGQLGWKAEKTAAAEPGEGIDNIQQAILAGIDAAARREIPERGPRGGLHWPLRYYVRRSAWHVLDHAWELEDRAIN